MSDTNFQPVFDYIDKTKEEILEQVASKVDLKKVQDTLDSLAKNHTDTNDKVTVLENKAERLEHWTMQAAEKLEVPYKP